MSESGRKHFMGWPSGERLKIISHHATELQKGREDGKKGEKTVENLKKKGFLKKNAG